MKEIKHISFSEMILIPSRNKFEGQLPLSHYLKDVRGSNGRDSSCVHVMLFNCESAEEISSLVDLEIKEANDSLIEYPDKKILLVELEFFSNLKREIENSALRHDAPEELINILSDMGFHGLKKENVIFMSGISSFVEV